MARRRIIDAEAGDDGISPQNGETAAIAEPPADSQPAETAAPVESAEVEATSEPTPAEGGSFLDYLSGHNVNATEFQGLGDEEILGRLTEGYTSAQQMQAELARQRQEAEWYRYQLAQAQQQRQQPAQPQVQPQEQPRAKWNPPEYDPNWLKLLKKDEQGNLVPVPGAAPDLVQKVTNYSNWLEEQQQKFYRDPADFIFQSSDLEDRIASRVNEIVEQRIVAQRNQEEAERAWQIHAGWMTEKDKTGNPIVGPNGMPQLTHEGQVALMETRRQMEMGRPFGEAFKVGYALAYQQVHQAVQVVRQQQTPATPEQKQANSNLGFLKKAVQKKPNLTGAAPAAGKQLPTSARFDSSDPEILKAMLTQGAREAGLMQ